MTLEYGFPRWPNVTQLALAATGANALVTTAKNGARDGDGHRT